MFNMNKKGMNIGQMAILIVGILVLFYLITIFMPMSVTNQDKIYDELNESGYSTSADILSAKEDTGNILVNVPTLVWVVLLIAVVALVIVAVKKF